LQKLQVNTTIIRNNEKNERTVLIICFSNFCGRNPFRRYSRS